jgi:hypothetical protein
VVNIEWLNFLSKFNNYDVYIIADDNSQDYKEKFKEFSKVKIIQFNDKECEAVGFTGLTKGIEPGLIVEGKKNKSVWAWDKAFYYFCIINQFYDYVWFLEEDVFIYDEMSLLKIDSKHAEEDLLSPIIYCDKVEENSNLGHPGYWWWKKICQLENFKQLTPLFYKSFAFHIRVSKKLIQKIKDHVYEYKSLFFLEAFIPMICIKNDLSYSNPIELQISRPCVELNQESKMKIFGVEKYYLFHPIKNLEEHEMYRKNIKKYLY